MSKIKLENLSITRAMYHLGMDLGPSLLAPGRMFSEKMVRDPVAT